MEGLYKSKGRFGLSGREKRKEINRLHSQTKKNDLLASKRKISMGRLDAESKFCAS